MDVKEAKELLDGCTRSELRDHAFGTVEVFWVKDGVEIGGGYFDGKKPEAWIDDPHTTFSGDDALTLRQAGTQGTISRNDTTGPENFVEGKIMPGLTKDAVRKELTKEK